ncbi:MAG: TetR/AcrR family transcriptional regulator [Pseudomonadota bacterium]
MSMGNRERLFSAASELFLEHGYNVSVDAIVCRAGVARQTFYNHFQSKECLFAEVVKGCVQDMLAPLAEPSGELRQTLKNFAQIYRGRALSPQGIASYRILTSQAQQFPDLIREVFSMGDGQLVGRLAVLLGNAMATGQLRNVNPVFAAEMLLAMLLGQERTQLLLDVPRPVEDEEKKVERAVDGFLRMFAPDQAIDEPEISR